MYAQCSGVAAAAVCVLVASGGGPASPGHAAPCAIQVAEQRDLGVGQRVLVERHPIFAVEPEHATDDETAIGVARDEGRTGDAALQGRRARIETQPAAAFLGSVALVAVLLEDGADVLVEVDGRLRLARRRRASADGKADCRQTKCQRCRARNRA